MSARTAPAVNAAGNRSYVLRKTGPTRSGDTAVTAAATTIRRREAPTDASDATISTSAAAPQATMVHLNPGAKDPGSSRTRKNSGCASGGYSSKKSRYGQRPDVISC